jgi:hypothetical protein
MSTLIFRLFHKFLWVLAFAVGNLAVADDVASSVSLSSRFIRDERISKISGNVFAIHPQSLFLVRGFDVSARNYRGRWSGASGEALYLNALSMAAFAVVPWNESFSNMFAIGASGFERGFERIRPEGVVHSTYKASSTLKYTAFLTWEAGTYEEIPFFLDFGVLYAPSSQVSLKLVLPAALEARWTDVERKSTYSVFLKTGREFSYALDNNNRLPAANSVLDIGRRGWKLGLGFSQRIWGGEVALESGAMVLQKLKVESRGKTVQEENLKSEPFFEMALKFPAFSFY